jgi:type I restriction enzyme S subunit
MEISINQNGWAVTRLEDIATRITKGGTPTTYGYSFQKSGINFLKVENIKNGRVNLKSITDFIGEDAHTFQSKSQLSVHDILFSIAGTIGETCVIKEEYLPANTNQALAIVKGTDCAMIPKLLELQFEAFVAKVKAKARGGAMNNVSLEDLKNLLVYIPPIPEQERLIFKIEELFSSLDKGIESLKTAQAQLKVYRQAVLKWAFEGKLTEDWRKHESSIKSADNLLSEIKKEREEFSKINKVKIKPIKELSDSELSDLPKLSDGWKWINIDAISEHEKHSIKAGPFGSSLKKEFYVAEGYKIYGQEQVISGDAYMGDYFVNEDKYQELFSCRIKPFDVLISLVGTIGKVLILPHNAQSGLINPRLIKISLNQKYYNPLFFKYYFESSFLRSIYKQNAHGATMDVLNLGIIQVLPFPMCSLKEQEQIIQEIESRLSVCDKIEESITTSLLQAESLRQSILKKAFEGKLVPQDPNDEPASVLLERIKAERGKNKPVKKVKARKTKKESKDKVQI